MTWDKQNDIKSIKAERVMSVKIKCKRRRVKIKMFVVFHFFFLVKGQAKQWQKSNTMYSFANGSEK